MELNPSELKPFISHRTYPQPDAPQLKGDARFRALAVFKYLQNLEPEAASRHPMFACIQHAFVQQTKAAYGEDLAPSMIEQIEGAPAKSVPFPAGEGGPV